MDLEPGDFMERHYGVRLKSSEMRQYIERWPNSPWQLKELYWRLKVSELEAELAARTYIQHVFYPPKPPDPQMIKARQDKEGKEHRLMQSVRQIAGDKRQNTKGYIAI